MDSLQKRLLEGFLKTDNKPIAGREPTSEELEYEAQRSNEVPTFLKWLDKFEKEARENSVMVKYYDPTYN